MTGMHKITGEPLADEAHIAQSIHDILTTPIGTRVMRRDYGSRLFELVDAPETRGTKMLLIAATAVAIRKHEPRVRLKQASVTYPARARPVLKLDAYRTDLPGKPPFSLSLAL